MRRGMDKGSTAAAGGVFLFGARRGWCAWNPDDEDQMEGVSGRWVMEQQGVIGASLGLNRLGLREVATRGREGVTEASGW